jgi:alkaline phosphatase
VVGVSEEVLYEQCDTLTEARKVDSLLKLAEDAGMSTGFVTTMRVTHASPANIYANCPSRLWESDQDKPSSASACKDVGEFVSINNKTKKHLGGC